MTVFFTPGSFWFNLIPWVCLFGSWIFLGFIAADQIGLLPGSKK